MPSISLIVELALDYGLNGDFYTLIFLFIQEMGDLAPAYYYSDMQELVSLCYEPLQWFIISESKVASLLDILYLLLFCF